MADNAFVKIGTALLKHQVKKFVGEEALGVIGSELAGIGGDKLDSWIGEQATPEQLEKAASYAHQCFRGKVNDDDLEQWMVSLPLGNLPKVVEALEELPKSPDETKLEDALRESVALNWQKLSPEQVGNAVDSFLSCLRTALLPIEKQTLMVIGRSVLRTEDKVNQLLKLVENLQAIKPDTPHLKPETPKWFFGHRYGDLESFTGRVDELKLLDEWLANETESLLIFNAFGGFGKSALTWHWLNNHVDKTIWSTAIWWSFYEKESGFDSFLAEALTHLGIETKERSSRQQVNDLLDVMQSTGLLIVLDGFERLLRQYGRMDAALQEDDEDAEIDPSQRDCTSQSAETFLRGLSDKKIISKVLVTSRLLPRVLEGKDGKLQRGCHEVNLKGFSPDDAVTYFHNEGIKKATRAEIIEVCSAYGYHPLSLSLLVGWINREDGNEHRGDIVEAKNLDMFGNIKARRDHVLERAYESLAPERRDLLSKVSCFRGSMEYAILRKVFPIPDLEVALLDLRKRGLLQYAGETGRYDMHPIVRHYAYDHFTDEKRRKEAHVELAMHFIDAMPVTNKNVKTLEDLTPVIELYHHMVRAGNLDEALKIYYDRLQKAIYFQFGAYQLEIELLRALFLDGEDKPPRLKRADAQALTLNALAVSYSLSGQPRRAVPLFEMQNAIREKEGNNKKSVAIGLGNVVADQLNIGALNEAERNVRRAIDLCNEIADEENKARSHSHLVQQLLFRGQWDEAEQNILFALQIFEKQNNFQAQSVAWSRYALRFLLMARENTIFDIRESKPEYLQSAIECAQRGLELAEGGDPNIGGEVVPRDLVRSHWLLGATYRVNNELTLAEENLSKALNLCRQINAVDAEAEILLDVARLSFAYGLSSSAQDRLAHFKDAQEKASEALMITERSGYVLQGADVNLFLAQLALTPTPLPQGEGQGVREIDKAKAKAYAEEAKKLATCDGPPYYYKVAYEEAERMLENLAG
jgi:tetratricopeptide (TPR) repeat protein